LFYDNADNVLSFYSDEADATLNIGVELWTRATNTSGSTIANGAAVYINSTSGGLPTIALAKANARATTHTLGVATHSIENGTEGWITVAGLVRGLDLSSYSAGDTLYLSDSTAGGYTTTKPTGGSYPIEMGDVLSNSATEGVLYMHMTHPLDASDMVIHYGEVYTNGNSVATVLTLTDTWYQFLGFDTNGVSQGTTPDHTNDHITVDQAGTYKVELSVSFSSSTGSDTYEIQVFKNNGTTGLANVHMERKLGTGGDIGAAQCGGLHTFAANDTVEVWIKSVAAGGGEQVTIKDANLNLTRLS
jgi:hypothetical protein